VKVLEVNMPLLWNGDKMNWDMLACMSFAVEVIT